MALLRWALQGTKFVSSDKRFTITKEPGGYNLNDRDTSRTILLPSLIVAKREAHKIVNKLSHATKRKSPAELDREIAAHLRHGYDDEPGAWQRGYDFAKEASRHETHGEMREVLRRSWPGASAYDQGFIAAYQDLLGIARQKRSHATRKGGGTGYEVSRTALGETRSVVFTSPDAAERFQAANKGSLLKEVQLDDKGRIIKRSHATKKASDKAIDSVHTFKMRDGRVVTTTWHDTKAAANQRIKNTLGRDPSADRVLPGGTLGRFKAITWSY